MADPSQPDPKSQIRAVPLDDVRRARGEAKVAMPRSKVASLRAFRRVRTDRIFGAIGILLVLLGTALIFAWEKPPPIDKKFGVEWPQSTFRENPIAGSRLTVGASQTHEYPFAVPNATALVFSLVWKDDVGNQPIEGDTFEFKIEAPAGFILNNATLRGHGDRITGGNITIPVQLNGIPDIASVNADTNETAFQAVGDRTNRTGFGTWKMTVTLISAPGDVKNEQIRGTQAEQGFCDPQVPDNPNCQPDGGQAYEIQIAHTTYSLRLKKLF